VVLLAMLFFTSWMLLWQTCWLEVIGSLRSNLNLECLLPVACMRSR
jgi:hypothetical protein